MSIEYVIILHGESHEIIYFKTTGDLDPDFLDRFRSSIQYKILDMPLEDGEIEQATLEGKYLITRRGKMTWVSLIVNQKPILIIREILNSFSVKFESLFKQEILELYTELNGDISIFKDGIRGKDLDELINREFHLYFALPFKTGSHKGMKLTPDSKKIYQLAKNLSHKSKGHLLLKNLLTKAHKTLDFDNAMTINVIHELVENKVLLPISVKRERRYILQH